ncbi:MAG: ApaLI family restriction endonuclease [Planctomycetaceae bacterium]|jgi:hypothetical protein|nr:ApaLI family restriction endonuclease [Planctomycetaceae bacterium]
MSDKNQLLLFDKIQLLADGYRKNLAAKIDLRTQEMEDDVTDHFLIYRVLGISVAEGKKIDLYQNKGRFLYKYAGSFLEEAAKTCLQWKFPNAVSRSIPNTESSRPKRFEIDCVYQGKAVEIKWREATTDGDHITKEHGKLLAIGKAGLIPIRVMFYYHQREQAIRIQKVMSDLYCNAGGFYYFGNAAWQFIEKESTIDLFDILNKIAENNEKTTCK